MVGGGVRGKDTGIAHGTTTQVGATIKGFHLFIEGYPHTGGMTTGIVVGKGIGGTTNKYITEKLNETGVTGKKISIGSKKHGVFKVGETKGDHNNRLQECSNKELKKEGTFNNNTGMQVRNPEMLTNRTHNNNRETVKEGN
jgi:hypothetical protein